MAKIKPDMPQTCSETTRKIVDYYIKGVDKETGKPYNLTITGLAKALNTTRKKLLRYLEHPPEDYNPIIYAEVEYGFSHVEERYERLLVEHKAPAGVIFALKNLGWKDPQLPGTEGSPFVHRHKHEGSVKLTAEESYLQLLHGPAKA